MCCPLPSAGTRRKHQRRHQRPESQPRREALEGLSLLPIRAQPLPEDSCSISQQTGKSAPGPSEEGPWRHPQLLTPPGLEPKPGPPHVLLPFQSPQTLQRTPPALPQPSLQKLMPAAQGADEPTHLLTRPHPQPGQTPVLEAGTSYRTLGTNSHVILGAGRVGQLTETGKAPMRAGSWILWLLVSGSISSGLVPGVEAGGRPSGCVRVRVLQSSGGPRAGEDLSHPEPHLPTTGPVSQLPQTAKGAAQTLPATGPHSREAVPGRPTSLGHELLSPLAGALQAGRASVSPKWGYSQHPGPGVS